jgi:hypothetical protein
MGFTFRRTKSASVVWVFKIFFVLHLNIGKIMDKIKNAIMKHPNLSAWLVLALGMVLILVYEARDVGLQGSQWFWLVVVTVLVAGACIWIISWGDDDEELEAEVPSQDVSS